MKRSVKVLRSGVYQQDSTDCGAACLLTAIRYFGGSSTIEHIRNLSGTNHSGTSLLGLFQAAGRSGLIAEGCEASLADVIKYDDVLILHVLTREKMEHYVTFFGIEEERFIIWDPAAGLIKLSASVLEEIWVSKKCLTLKTGNNFIPEKKKNRSKMRWLIRMLKNESELIITSIFTGVLISVLGLIMAVYTQKLIDKIIPSADRKLLILSSLIVFILFTARLGLTAVRQYFLNIQGRSFNIRIVDNFFRTLLRLPKPFFDTRKKGDFVARLNDTMRIQRVIAEIAGVYIIDMLILITALVMIFSYSPGAGIITIASLPVIYFTGYGSNKALKTAQREMMMGYAMNESNFIDSLGGITEIKSLDWYREFNSRNHLIYSDFQNRIFNLGKLRIMLGISTGLAGTLYLVLLLTYSSLNVMGGSISAGELMAVVSLGSTLLPSLFNLALLNVPLNEAQVAIDRMFEFTLIEPEEPENDVDGLSVAIDCVELENITFRFPGSRSLFENVSIGVEKGRVTTLVGESGCGKSTIAAILMRFYLPESGKILINGKIDHNEIPLQLWRSNIALIPQEIHIFNGTLLQNLISDISEKKVSEMIVLFSEYGLNGFIESFPAGLMTIIGEGGITLSGGQRQMLAFIRVLLRRPGIIIIDEATSNMDRNTESQMLGLIRRLKKDVGFLLISHRLAMVKNISDVVYVMDGGTIAATGSHDELLGSENLYKRLWVEY